MLTVDGKEVKIINSSNDFEVESTLTNLEQMTTLEQYIKKYVLGASQYKISKKELTFMVTAALLGAAWGIPWRQAAADAANIFPAGLMRQIFAQLFANGIAITVGGDGLWVMLEIGKIVSSKSKKQQALTTKNQSRSIKIFKMALPAFFALFSCISAVYATVKYNTGLEKFFGIITFIDNYGYAIYGYSKLIDRLFDNMNLNEISKPSHDQLLKIKNNFLKNLLYSITNKESNEFNNLEQFVQKMLSEKSSHNQKITYTKYLKQAFQLTFSSLIPISSSIVGVFLTKEFIENSIYNNTAFALIIAILSEAPGFVITALSTHSVFGRLFDILFRQGGSSAKESLVRQIYPIATIVLPAVILALSLTAPSAGAFITYNTLGQAGLNSYLQWIATGSIIAARIIFSNFTLNSLVGEFLITLYEKSHPPTDIYNKKIRLEKFSGILANTNITFFKKYLPKSLDAATIEKEAIKDKLIVDKNQDETARLISDDNETSARKGYRMCGII